MESCSSNTREIINFRKEISDMMHGFGDNCNPNPATVVLVENIVLHQLRSLLQQAYFISESRGYKVITNYEVIFMMRRNTYKLKQLHDYQLSLDRLDSGIANASVTDDEVIQEFEIKFMPKLKRNHIDIIAQLDEVNEVKYMKVNTLSEKRKIKAVKLAERIPLERYEAFINARCSSFRSGTFQNMFAKLEYWLNPSRQLKITPLAMEVVGFVAYETVAELVDSALKVRQDANKKPRKRCRKLEGGCHCTPEATPNGANTKSWFEGSPAITEAEIQEAVQRFFLPDEQMNGLFSRNMRQDIPVTFIAF